MDHFFPLFLLPVPAVIFLFAGSGLLPFLPLNPIFVVFCFVSIILVCGCLFFFPELLQVPEGRI
jgi:hypothetical protein